MKTIRIATRGSALALYQAHAVKDALAKEGYASVIVEVKTKGDLNQTSPLREIGGDGLFVRAVEDKLLAKEADIAVHSGKDLPFSLQEGLMIAAVLHAADPRDCLISRPEKQNALRVIGTGSARRISEYKKIDPEANCVSIRGNVPTRLSKLQTECDAVILAKAGLDRLAIPLDAYTTRIFCVQEMIPAGCQGIIAIECKKEDESIRAALSRINHAATWQRFSIERKLFCLLEANCSQAVGVHAIPGEKSVELLAKLDEKRVARTVSYEELDEACREIAQELLEEKA
jgi:hydroxymethylbilane synthase